MRIGNEDETYEALMQITNESDIWRRVTEIIAQRVGIHPEQGAEEIEEIEYDLAHETLSYLATWVEQEVRRRNAMTGGAFDVASADVVPRVRKPAATTIGPGHPEVNEARITPGGRMRDGLFEWAVKK